MWEGRRITFTEACQNHQECQNSEKLNLKKIDCLTRLFDVYNLVVLNCSEVKEHTMLMLQQKCGGYSSFHLVAIFSINTKCQNLKAEISTFDRKSILREIEISI